MQKLTSTEGLLIVVELGAEWPTSEIDAARNSKARRVLAQDETESPAAFAHRLGEQLSSSFPSGVALASVVVACSERIDEHAQGGRAELARTAQEHARSNYSLAQANQQLLALYHRLAAR